LQYSWHGFLRVSAYPVVALTAVTAKQDMTVKLRPKMFLTECTTERRLSQPHPRHLGLSQLSASTLQAVIALFCDANRWAAQVAASLGPPANPMTPALDGKLTPTADSVV
jgi:hypothetical protein